MIYDVDAIPPENIWVSDHSSGKPIPFYLSKVPAGFASPAENYLRARLSLDQLCIQHPDASYFVEVEGESMVLDNILPRSILVVDAMIPVETGKVVVAWVNGECTVKRLVRYGRMIVLFPSNPAFLPIYVHPDVDQFQVLGVVIRIVSEPQKWSSDQLKDAQEYVRLNRRE